jgi:hypothetical protein
MFLVLSRSAATAQRGDFAVDFKSYDEQSCEVALAELCEADKRWHTPRERVVVQIMTHHDPSNDGHTYVPLTHPADATADATADASR